eukprot:CAMPEP_0167768672 /NCGR_PEP_ID=MMETSP0110_2-20121227/16815_1 /TAXON_ID=629695 /ORGANISM="Gymnochlora sp., Strain CCMP2014" /LENGTH=397 /DNA_ID=CAMNT_0007657407 /DNA_START=69 /DNA_END=1262 /DNA_ORIENTATION=+
MNQSQSSYGRFSIHRSFFNSFRASTVLKCKVNLRLVLLAFRSLSSTKQITFSLTGHQNELTLELQNHNGIKREYKFPFEEKEDIPQAEIPYEDYNLIGSRAKQFQAKVMDNFASGLVEITFTTTCNSLIVKSFFEEGTRSKFFHTECQLSSSDLKEFKVNPESYGLEITFPQREMKAMLTFCRDQNFDVFVRFGAPGMPLVMTNSLDKKVPLYTEIIVSTLGERGASQSQAPSQPRHQSQSRDQSQEGSEGKRSPMEQEISQEEKKSYSGEEKFEEVEKVEASSLTPTQTSSWVDQKSSITQTRSNSGEVGRSSSSNRHSSGSEKQSDVKSQSELNSEVGSKFSFDLFPPAKNKSNTNKKTYSDKKRRLDRQGKSEHVGSRCSDSDESFVAGTPDTD